MVSETPKYALWALYKSANRAIFMLFLLTLTYLSNSNGYTIAAVAFGIFTVAAIVFTARKFLKERERAKYYVQDTLLFEKGS